MILSPGAKYTLLQYPDGRAELVREVFDGVIYDEEVIGLKRDGEWQIFDGRVRNLVDTTEDQDLGIEGVPEHREVTKEEVAMILFGFEKDRSSHV